jgi:hypothetical protein
MKEAWLFQGAVVPVDTETTQALVAEIKRLIDVVGGMALAQRTWVGLTELEKAEITSLKWWDWEDTFDIDGFIKAIEAKLKEKNT